MPSVVMNEIIPPKTKGLAGSFVWGSAWLTSIVVVGTFNILLELLGAFGYYLMFSAFCVLLFAYVLIFVPETKGKSFADIQLYFAGKG